MTIEIIMIIYTLLTSPIAGLAMAGYVVKTKRQIKELENRNKTLQSLQKSIEEQEIPVPTVKPTTTPTFLHQYKECLIEDYNRQFFIIMKPSGEKLDKTFLTLESAKKEIDFVYPFFEKQVYTKRKVYNMRYVR